MPGKPIGIAKRFPCRQGAVWTSRGTPACKRENHVGSIGTAKNRSGVDIEKNLSKGKHRGKNGKLPINQKKKQTKIGRLRKSKLSDAWCNSLWFGKINTLGKIALGGDGLRSSG